MTTIVHEKAHDVTLLHEAEHEQVPAGLVDIVAQALMDKIEEQKHKDMFLDQVISRVKSWQAEAGITDLVLHSNLNFCSAETGLHQRSISAFSEAGNRGARRLLFHRYEDDNFSGLRTRLLVSSFKSGLHDGGIFELDFGANTYRQIIHCDGRGLAQYGNGYIVASRDQGLFVLDGQLDVVQNHSLPSLDLHGVACGPDGLVYLVETRHNRIGIYRMDPFERVDEIVVSPDAEDRNHVNDLCFRDGTLLLSMFSTQDFWRENMKSMIFDGAIVEYDVREKKVICTIANGLQMPHTLKLVEGELCYCESFGLNVMHSGKKIAQYFGYTRGLAHDGHYFFVGQSRLRHRNRHTELTLSSDAGVHILEPQAHLSRFIPLPTPDVYSILVINQ